MKKFLKQLFCKHESIYVKTEMSKDSLLIIKSLIQCENCKKCFTHHPNERCCYVMHLHGEIMKEHFIAQIKQMQQPISKLKE